MNNEALLIVGAPCNEAEKILTFIQTKTKGLKGEEHEILDTFPILYIRNDEGQICKELAPYIAEELTFDKGCDKAVEQYSGFEGVNEAGQSLGEILELLDTTDVYVCGIATEYCVRNTCEDLLKAGFKVHLLKDCIAYVDHDGHLKALKEMEEQGIHIE